MIGNWYRDVANDGRHFAILRVPRAIELEKPLDEQDAFAPRLHAFCDSAGIALLDPTPRLLAGRREGREMYDDHFTPDGHAAVSEVFVDWLLNQWK